MMTDSPVRYSPTDPRYYNDTMNGLRNILHGSNPWPGNAPNAEDWFPAKLYATDGLTPEGFSFKEWQLDDTGTFVLRVGARENDYAIDPAYFIDTSITWTIDDPETDPPVLVRRAAGAGGTKWEIVKMGNGTRGDYYTMNPSIPYSGDTTVLTPDGGSPVESVLCWTTTEIPANFDAVVLVGLSLLNMMYWRPDTTIGASLGVAGASRTYALLARVDDSEAVLEYLGTSGAFAEKYTMFYTSNVAGTVAISDLPPYPTDDSTVFTLRIPPRDESAKYAIVLMVDYFVPAGAVAVTTNGYVFVNRRTADGVNNNCGTFITYTRAEAGGEFLPDCSPPPPELFTTSGDYTPTFTGTVQVECQAPSGGGAGGAVSLTQGGGGGGGGGEYAKSTGIAVTSGVPVAIVVGTKGTGGTAGNGGTAASGNSTYGGTVVVAIKGNKGETASGTTGGTAGSGGTGGTGDTLRAGGNGGAGGNGDGIITGGGGGGGGGGPGTSAAGSNGTAGSSSTPGVGGAGGAGGGGAGGNGGNVNTNNATAGSTESGAGGGGGAGEPGKDGVDGWVLVTPE